MTTPGDREQGGELELTDDATRVVPRPVPTPLPEPEDDATRVVPRPTPEPEPEPEADEDDATRVVARAVPEPELDEDDATRVVPRVAADTNTDTPAPADTEADDDATRAVPRAAPPVVPQVISHGTPTTPTNSARNPAPPVEEPDEPIVRGLPAKMFKRPLDARRTARPSPFPADPKAVPRGGVQRGVPVAYDARSPQALQQQGWQLGEAPLGQPPTGSAPAPADRSNLPAIERQNARYRLIALGGGAAVLVCVACGLWGIAALAFG